MSLDLLIRLSMAKDPAFLFYTKDFYEGVSTLNFEDRGKYITLLCVMHQQGRIDEETIRFLVGSVSVKLKSKFSVDDNGLWFNERLENEIEKRNNFVDSRRENGKMGGRPKANAEPLAKPNGKPTGKPTHNLPANANGNTIEYNLKSAFDEVYIDQQKTQWGHIDFDFEYKTFCDKVRGSPGRYIDRDSDGLRLALQSQLRSAKHKRNTEQKNNKSL